MSERYSSKLSKLGNFTHSKLPNLTLEKLKSGIWKIR